MNDEFDLHRFDDDGGAPHPAHVEEPEERDDEPRIDRAGASVPLPCVPVLSVLFGGSAL